MGQVWNGVVIPSNVFIDKGNGKRRPKMRICITHKGVKIRKLSLKVGLIEGDLSEKAARITRMSLTEAEKTLAAIEVLADRNEFDPKTFFGGNAALEVDVATPGATLIGAVLDSYLTWQETRVRGQTLDKYRQHIENWIRPQWGHLRAEELTMEAATAWVVKIRKGEIRALNGRGDRLPQPGTVEAILKPFLKAVSRATKVFPGGSPIKGLIAESFSTDSVNNLGTYKVIPFDRDERKLIADAAKDDPQMQRLVAFWFWTGLRIGELFALRSDKVSLQKLQIHIHRQWVGKEVSEDMKTNASRRDVPLLPQAYQALEEQMKANAQRPHATDFIWTTVTGLPVRRPSDWMGEKWKALLLKAGVAYRNPEQCRHTFASIMSDMGEDIRTVSAIMGHTDVTITQRVYTRMFKNKETPHGFRFNNSAEAFMAA